MDKKSPTNECFEKHLHKRLQKLEKELEHTRQEVAFLIKLQQADMEAYSEREAKSKPK